MYFFLLLLIICSNVVAINCANHGKVDRVLRSGNNDGNNNHIDNSNSNNNNNNNNNSNNNNEIEENQESNLYGGFLTAFNNCITPDFSCPNENITFWLYTRENQENPWQLLEQDPNTISGAPIKNDAPWKLLVHGYTGWKDYTPNPEIRPKYFEHGEYNIISIDYKPLAMSPCYPQAARNVPLISNCTARLLHQLIEKKIMDPNDLHVIGFSLGAQVAGSLSNFYGYNPIPRITGLDPAMPLFMASTAEGRLDKTDAAFVDVIHTNAGWKGQVRRCGHVDFYPNGGYTQPGCNESSEYGATDSCYHARAPVYFGESINSEIGFWAVPCQNWLAYTWGWCPASTSNQMLMGDPCPKRAKGIYYLNTNSESPYALGRQSRCQ